ncbi:hypothetical protein BpHYR1_005365 [Brachionus plicatilis]|uniref:Uncharacterized protein n=1 Tax=Brachionus plicatilis TaxID=10195 RepID=A0A3M7SAM4_BRAPC|nr:hypothetical protein BpHYR1_005365 [Brachionus plicatilis]
MQKCLHSKHKKAVKSIKIQVIGIIKFLISKSILHFSYQNPHYFSQYSNVVFKLQVISQFPAYGGVPDLLSDFT